MALSLGNKVAIKSPAQMVFNYSLTHTANIHEHKQSQNPCHIPFQGKDHHPNYCRTKIQLKP